MSQATAHAPAPPTSTDVPAPVRRTPRIVASVGSKIVWMLLGAILFSPLATAVGIYIENRGWLDFLGRQPTVGEQLGTIRQAAADDGRRFAVFERLRLHDSATSYLVILADEKPFEGDHNARSDEVRIYDTVQNTLALRFQFLPEPRGGDDPFAYPYLFRFDKAADIDGDGLQEVLGSYTELYADGEFRSPVLLGWDPAIGRYRMAPLLSSPPRLALHGSRGLYGRAVQSMYRDSVRLADARSGVTYIALAADDYAWARDKRSGSAVLLAAYTARAKYNAAPHLLQVVPLTVRVTWPTPEVNQCDLYHSRAVFLTPTFEGGSLQRQVFEAWHDHPDSNFIC